jgi:aminopeptidase N
LNRKEKCNLTQSNSEFTSKPNGFASKEAKLHYAPDSILEPVNLSLNLEFDIKNRMVHGQVGIKIVAKSKHEQKIVLNGIDLNIESIQSISSNGEEDINWRYDNKEITVFWSDQWKENEERDLIIAYKVKDPISGLYFSYPTEREPDLPVFVVTDNEAERARYWLPCIDHPSVRCKLNFNLTSEANHTILANGKLVSESVKDDKKLSKWELDYPCPSYLIAICVGEFVSYKDRDADAGLGPIPVEYFTTKRYSPEDLKRTYEKTPKIIEWMNKRLGLPYPFPKYYQVSVPLTYGAIENISLIRWGEMYVMDEIWYHEFAHRLELVNVHEMAHQWFGDIVVIKDFAHLWLKESMASYVETLWLEDNVSSEAADYDRYLNEISYFGETEKYFRPIVTNKYDASWDLYDRHTYPGGCQRVDMLRKFLGDNIFFPALTEYLQTFQMKTAETIDFQRIFENKSSLNLQKFFDVWIYGKGYPKIKISSKFDDKDKLLNIRVKQTQQDPEKGIGIFEFKLEILVRIQGKSTLYVFDISSEDNSFYINAEENPELIEIDPKHKILMEIDYNADPEVLKEIIKDGSIKNKILSSFELAKSNWNEAIDFLSKEIQSDIFWGLKVQFIKALATIPQKKAIETILEIVEKEKDAKVLNQALISLENLKLEGMREKIKELIIKKDPYYYMSFGRLLKLYASYRSPRALEFLISLNIEVDKKNFVEQNRLEAIGILRSTEAIDYLFNKFKSRNIPSEMESSLIRALGNSIKWANSQVKDQIKEELQKYVNEANDQNSLMATASVLADLNDKSVIPTLKIIKQKIAQQSQTRINKLIKKVSSSSPNDESSQKNLEERLEKLEKDNLELKDKMNRLNSIINNKFG